MSTAVLCTILERLNMKLNNSKRIEVKYTEKKKRQIYKCKQESLQKKSLAFVSE